MRATEPERERRHSADVRVEVGRHLLTREGRTRAVRAQLAAALHVTQRTLRTWAAMAASGSPLPKMGRKPHGPAAHERAAGLVAEQRGVQGSTAGWRPIEKALEGLDIAVPTKLIQRELSRQKAEDRRRDRERRETHREGHEVCAKNVIWCEDETALGHAPSGELHGEVVRDVGSSKTLRATVGAPTNAQDVITGIEEVARERGVHPLVWQSDNGPPYVAEKVEAHLALHFITTLRSRTYTSTDNPAAEHGIGELKAESGLDAPFEVEGADAARRRLEAARRRLDDGRLRASRGWKTATRCDADLPEAESLVSRAVFYEAARSAVAAAVLGIEAPRARRKAERDAIWKTLETFGLARRHVGARRTPNPRRPLTESPAAATIPP